MNEALTLFQFLVTVGLLGLAYAVVRIYLQKPKIDKDDRIANLREEIRIIKSRIDLNASRIDFNDRRIGLFPHNPSLSEFEVCILRKGNRTLPDLPILNPENPSRFSQVVRLVGPEEEFVNYYVELRKGEFVVRYAEGGHPMSEPNGIYNLTYDWGPRGGTLSLGELHPYLNREKEPPIDVTDPRPPE